MLERKRVEIVLFGPNSPVSDHIQCVNPMQIILIANPIYTTLTHAYHQIKKSKISKNGIPIYEANISYFLVHLLKGKKS